MEMSGKNGQRTRMAAFAVLFAAMAAAGWKLGGPAGEEEPPIASKPLQGKSAQRVSARSFRGGPTESAAARMKALRSATRPEDRMRATIEVASTLPVEELGKWIEGSWFSLSSGFDQTLFTKIAMERWRREDPEGLILWSLKNNRGEGYQMLAGWVADDPRRALDFFKENPDDGNELRLLAEVAKHDPSLALGRLREMLEGGLPGEVAMFAYLTVQELAKRLPEELEELLAEMPTTIRHQVEGALTRQRLAGGFQEEVRRLWEQPDGWRRFEAGISGLDQKVLAEGIVGMLGTMPASWRNRLANEGSSILGRVDAEQMLASDFAGAGFSEEQVSKIRGAVLLQISGINPERVFSQLDTVDDFMRSPLIRGTMYSLASDPEKVGRLMAMLDTETDLELARSALADRDADRSHEMPSEPREWLGRALEVKPGHEFQLVHSIDQWDAERVAGLQEGFRAMSDEDKSGVARVIAQGGGYGNSESLRSLQGEAIRHLVENPPAPVSGEDTDSIAMQAASYAARQVRTDPDAATGWVQTLPGGPVKLEVQKNIATNWALYDTAAAKRWVASLPATERGEVEAFMKKQQGGK